MDIKEYLLTDRSLNRSELAKLMWPHNKSADTYLNQKLGGLRRFTLKDAQKALVILKQMATRLNNLNLEGEYPQPKSGPKPKNNQLG